MTRVWELYDALIDGIPRDIVVTDSLVGTIWSAVCTEESVGLAMTTPQHTRPQEYCGDMGGMKLVDMAKRVKSWHFIEAGLGMAAINAYYNAQALAQKNGVLVPKSSKREQDAFIASYDEIAGKRVCVVGHFPFLERRIHDICDFAIIERQPQTGDYPDPACEYLLPAADYVFITGSALTNKTMPRLLELSRHAKTTLVGTSVPLAPILFDFDVDCLAGFMPTDREGCWRIAAYDHDNPLSSAGQRVRLIKPR